ncbi:hypothetical protein [Flagellimonas beolgyonensis]|uniref:hypothetical protein n=1 Tax=Flagellimonas beolgyonensis TaxID=864064 RepID=UPI003D6490D5
MVVSSYGNDLGETRPGHEFDEFAQALLIFKNNHLSIDVASPKGCKVEADQYNKEKPYNHMLLGDKHALHMLDHPKATADISAAGYDAFYIFGANGAMFDLSFLVHYNPIPFNVSFQNLQNIYGTVPELG